MVTGPVYIEDALMTSFIPAGGGNLDLLLEAENYSVVSDYLSPVQQSCFAVCLTPVSPLCGSPSRRAD
ncbi:hypothetical protein EYF80_042095 [Liparis tanakae]|uniref:Uncharacterized protein n=1 Tax=Liparis tanakae TaxID=230148 RepID=A0A4Z2G2C7_9TELE|nr:hypothetical protein EYF80_042095 [Liparis tanakae]